MGSTRNPVTMAIVTLRNGAEGITLAFFSGEGVKAVSDSGLRKAVNEYFDKHGIEATQKKWPEYKIK
jgi:hypothetical protein